MNVELHAGHALYAIRGDSYLQISHVRRSFPYFNKAVYFDNCSESIVYIDRNSKYVNLHKILYSARERQVRQ